MIFDVPLLCYYITLRSSIIFCLSFGDIYLSFRISVSLSTVFKVFCDDFFEAFVISLAILLLIKSPVLPLFFETVLSASVADYLV